MTAETPTPLTDAAHKRDYIGNTRYELLNLAKQLERRCAELEEENARSDHCYKLSLDSMQLHKDKADELRRDRERLDWLLAKDPAFTVILDYAWDPAFDSVITLDSRAALDKAIRDSQTGNASDE